MIKNVKFLADSQGVTRTIAISAAAVAVAVYAMVIQGRTATNVALAAVVILIVTGAMLQVGRAVRQLHRQQDQARRAAQAAERHYFKVLRRVVAAIEARQSYTSRRSRRVGNLARKIAEGMGFSAHLCRLLDMAGQVHDIGFLAVPERVVNKPGRLGAEEFRSVKKHAEVSYRILEPLTFLAEVLPAVRYHHERMNGTGYPYELRGEEIPLPARILAVADAYEAMTHDRPYRPALSMIEAIEELRHCAPAGYDPRCVEALEDILNVRSFRQVAASPEGAPKPVST